MINGQVSNKALSPKQVGTLAVNVYNGELLFSFKDVEPPFTFGFSGYRRLVVLNDNTPICVRVFCQLSGYAKVWFFLFRRRTTLICRAGFKRL